MATERIRLSAMKADRPSTQVQLQGEQPCRAIGDLTSPVISSPVLATTTCIHNPNVFVSSCRMSACQIQPQTAMEEPDLEKQTRKHFWEKLSIRSRLSNAWKRYVFPGPTTETSFCQRDAAADSEQNNSSEVRVHHSVTLTPESCFSTDNPESKTSFGVHQVQGSENDCSVTVEHIVLDRDIQSLTHQMSNRGMNHSLFPRNDSQLPNVIQTSVPSSSQNQPGDRFLNDLERGGLDTFSPDSCRPQKSETVKDVSLEKACFAKDKAWSNLYHFFDLTFTNLTEEQVFQKDAWYQRKRISLCCSSFYLLNWITSLAFSPRPFDLVNNITIYGFAPILCAGLVLSIIHDLPQRSPFAYQVWLWLSTWSWTILAIAEIQYCGYYNINSSCARKDFMGFMYGAIALPSVGVLGMGMNRTSHFMGSAILVILIGVYVAPHSPTWIKNLCNFSAFSLCVLIVQQMREKIDRRLWRLRDELNRQCKATQKAQVAEAESNDSKRRFTSYIFHEIRVPLNTAFLALQNLESMGVFSTLNPNKSDGVPAYCKPADDGNVEWQALNSSFSMMQKVLNDVLDFSKMDAGKLEVVYRPFYFHASLRNNVLHSVETLARAKGLRLTVDLDPRIDEVALHALRTRAFHQGNQPDGIVEGITMGDELRLRQILSNLFSNATKFTPSGGTIGIKTQLIHPVLPPMTNLSPSSSVGSDLRSHSPFRCQNTKEISVDTPACTEILVRIEVSDSGIGIAPEELADSRLFSPYVQTTAGRCQGGKGTGLGLAIVRSIVQLSNGRLGVISRKGHGSIFWIELPLGTALAYNPSTSGVITPSTPLARTNSRMGSWGTGSDCPTPFPPFDPLCGASCQITTEVSQFQQADARSKKTFSIVKLESGSSFVRREFNEGSKTGTQAWRQKVRDDCSRKLTIFKSSSLPHASRIRHLSKRLITRPSEISNDVLHRSTKTVGVISRGTEGLICDDSGDSSDGEMSFLINLSKPFPLEPDKHAMFGNNLPVASPDTYLTLDATADPENDQQLFFTPESSNQITIHTAGEFIAESRPCTNLADKSKGRLNNEFSGATLESPCGLESDGRVTVIHESSERLGQDKNETGLTRPLQILLADDDALTRKLMSRMLTRQGHVCTEAIDGGDALEKLEQEEYRYDLVLLDNFMPRKTGVEVVRELRMMGRKDMVCGCTANAEKQDQNEYLSAGLDELLTKPISQKDLFDVCAVAQVQKQRREICKKS